MEKWDIVAVIITLMGMFCSVIAPVVKLTRVIARLTATVEILEKNISELTVDNRTGHERLWAHERRQDDQLCDHESRIRVIEDK